MNAIYGFYQKNLQYIMKRNKHAMTPMGPYCRHMALKLICLACFRYLADSSRREPDNVDMPSNSTHTSKDRTHTIERISAVY